MRMRCAVFATVALLTVAACGERPRPALHDQSLGDLALTSTSSATVAGAASTRDTALTATLATVATSSPTSVLVAQGGRDPLVPIPDPGGLDVQSVRDAQERIAMPLRLPDSLGTPEVLRVVGGEPEYTMVLAYFSAGPSGRVLITFKADREASKATASQVIDGSGGSMHAARLATGIQAAVGSGPAVASVQYWLPGKGTVVVMTRAAPEAERMLVDIANETLTA